MGTKPIVVSKYYRIRMTEELRSMLESIPVQDVTEEPRGDHVYLGLGKMVVGARAHPATVRVDAGPFGMSLTVSAPGAGVRPG